MCMYVREGQSEASPKSGGRISAPPSKSSHPREVTQGKCKVGYSDSRGTFLTTTSAGNLGRCLPPVSFHGACGGRVWWSGGRSGQEPPHGCFQCHHLGSLCHVAEK